MIPKTESLAQPDGSGLIPIMLFVWLASITLYGIVWIGAGCYEALSDAINGVMKLIFGG
ncbi:MAG: hypothetical protein HYZ07_00435 [Candidatus Harrisonbacteria bacterium]|nr:hypothetical protein [Candidatus Harrisonbacteria bacterium]MBI2406425.1 hypothetical protein [Candidatus Harrisonbacteria bacterium]MBI2604253.1 hypothetical protein [Candidatus Harrisonbacteria bacterium]MBI3114410.1 hypothetical protein [Candidatus Harrisonbacteria bacterium]